MRGILISPVTFSEDISLLRTFDVERIADDWKKYFQIDVTDEFRGHKSINLYECNRTKLKFFMPAEVMGSDKLYDRLQKFSWYYMPQKWEFKYALKDISGCKNILEIGAGRGYFVKLGIDTGFNIRGIELCEKNVEIAKENGLPVERIDLKKAADLFLGSMDAVVSFQVLEHVTNPYDFISWSIQTLRPNGKLIYSVPNSESYLRFQEYNLLDMPPHHMTRWSEYSFRSLEKIFPLKLEKIIFEPLARYHINEFLNSCKNHFCANHFWGKLFFNCCTFSACRTFLALGLRRFFIGHTLYAQFKKI